MKKLLFYSCYIYLLLTTQTAIATPINPYMKLDSFLFSEPVSIYNVLNDKQNNYSRGGRDQYASVWVETGFRKGAWIASTLYREEHRYTFSSDTADLYNSTSTTHTVDPNRQYQIDLAVERFRAKGLRLGYQWSKPDKFTIQLGGSYFQANHLLSGTLKGSATANTSSDYDYLIDVDYAYEEEALFGRGKVEAPDGKGVSLDLNGTWKFNNKLSLSAEIKDIYGKIHWEKTPVTIATATSDIKNIGSDGFIIITPTVQGVHKTKSTYTQTIKPSGSLNLKYQMRTGKDALLLKTRSFSKRTFAAIGGEHHFMNGTVSVAIWPTLKTLEVGYSNKRISLNLGIDNINLKDANTFWLSLGLK